jgi:hypothetical protein
MATSRSLQHQFLRPTNSQGDKLVGVYHLMGLGRSPGTVIGPLSYLAHRYSRWNKDDQHFFARSGEVEQRKARHKVGDVQAIVFFSTPEVLLGKEADTGKPFHCFRYIENPPGRVTVNPEGAEEPMKGALQRLLKKEWSAVSGGRQAGTVFWCKVDRRDIVRTYERIIQVVTALSGVGSQGKEMWVNLTGGNNVINFALEMAATLSGGIARLYYVQAENPTAEKCVRFTAEEGYWVELPVMPLALSPIAQAILEVVQTTELIDAYDLYSRLSCHNEFWNLVKDLQKETFREIALKPMWKQGLLAEVDGSYTVGPQWELIRPYEELLQQARRSNMTIDQLAQQEPWIEQEELNLN